MVRSRRVSSLTAALAAGGIVLGAGSALAQDTKVSTGLTIRLGSGTFGSAQTTRLLYVPASLRVDVGRFEISGSFPFVSVMDGTVLWSQGGYIPMQGTMTGSPAAGMPMGPNGMMGGGMMGNYQTQTLGTPAPGTTTLDLISQSGLGDGVAGAGYRVVDNATTGLQVVLGTRIKIPTASSSQGLGTGMADVAGTATVRRRLARGWIYGDAGFVKTGNPAGVRLNNAFLWGVGGGRQIAPRMFLLGAAYGNSATVSEFGAPAELSAGIGLKISERASLTVLPFVGLTQASPKFGLTIGISSDMMRR
jgi:hypothetical protein